MNKIETLCVFFISLLVVATVFINIRKQMEVDHSKIPPKVELSSSFQKWITNLRNKGVQLEADEFTLVEENEIYNTKWMKIYSMDEPGMAEELDRVLLENRNQAKVIYAPSDRHFIDFSNKERYGYQSNEVRLYGLKEDKIIDAKVVDCSVRGNCYYDRGYFLDNDVFVVTEVSRNITKHDETVPACLPSETCTYSFKLHLVDLNRNSRIIYESTPFDAVLDKLIPEL